VALGQVLLEVLQFSPVNHHSTSVSYLSITTPKVCDKPAPLSLVESSPITWHFCWTQSKELEIKLTA